MCVTSQSKIKLCRDGPTYVDHVLSKDRGHNASLDPQLLGLKSSTLPPSHCAPFAVCGPATPRSQVKHSTTEPLRPLCCLKKMQCSFITPVMPYGIASYFTATYVDPASSGSLVIRLPPSMWRECNEPMLPPF